MTDYLKDATKAGLSAKAASVYTVMLEAGSPLPPKALVTRTKLHRQYVYDGLRELQDRRLVIVEGKKRRVRYQAVSPEKLLQEAEKIHLDVLDGVSTLMKLYDRSPAGIIEIIRGSKNVIEDELQLLREAKEGDYLDIVGGGGNRWVELYGNRTEEWEELRKKKKIKVRYIGVGDDVRHNREESVIENESRVIEGIGDAITVSIRPGSVSFNFYVPETMIVRVKNKEVVESQKALFKVLWEVAK